MNSNHEGTGIGLNGARILIVDDVPGNLDFLCDALESSGYCISAAPSGEVALGLARLDPPELILLDILMPGMDGLETCRRLKAADGTRSIPVIFITANDRSEHVREGFKAGGVDYIVKPIQTDELLCRVEAHLKISRLARSLVRNNEELSKLNDELRSEIERRERAEGALELISESQAKRWDVSGLIGDSPRMEDLRRDIRRLSRFRNTNALIMGESGTGKELVARALHFGSERAKGPFIPVNCAAIPAELAESTLFGHRRGAFTGAAENRSGCFEQAHGGTLFLDEIGDMPLLLQAKFLRALEDGVICPVGGTKEKKVDVRVVAATNSELEAAVSAGRFREDLFYRLAAFVITPPPLREHPEDIPCLAEHLLEQTASEMGMATPAISAEAMRIVKGYSYPGNVRELRNVVERALIGSGGETIRKDHVQFVARSFRPASGAPPRSRTLHQDAEGRGGEGRPTTEEEIEMILAHIGRTGSICNAACRELLGVGMHRAWYLLNKLQNEGRIERASTGRWSTYRLSNP